MVPEALVFARRGMRDELAVIGYIRVSSVGQATRGGGQETQEAAVRAAGAKLIYRDVVSGVSTERSGLDEMLRSLREGDKVVVYRLDRLSRSVGHLLTLCEDFEGRGVTLVSTSEGVNTAGAIGRLLVAVIGAVASIERETMLSRTADGIARARAEGKPWGRPQKLGAPARRAIVRAYRAGLGEQSASSLARELGAVHSVSPRTVFRILAEAEERERA